MKAPFMLFVRRCRDFVAVKAGRFLHLFLFKRRLLPPQVRLVVFGSLERKAPALIGYSSRVVGHLPVGADRRGMALVTSARRGDAFPGGEHGATADGDNRTGNK